MTKPVSLSTFLGSLIVILALNAATASAAMLTMNFAVIFQGAGSPAESGPWLVATFEDGPTPGQVILTLIAENLVAGEKVKGCYFNLDPTLDPLDLSFSAPTTLAGQFDAPAVSTGDDAFKADGDGYFDIRIEFPTADGAPTTFGAGDAVQFTLDNIPSLSADSFDFMSVNGGGVGEFLTAAHLLSLGAAAESAWATVPEPATLLLFAAGALAIRRKRRN